MTIVTNIVDTYYPVVVIQSVELIIEPLLTIKLIKTEIFDQKVFYHVSKAQ